MLSLAFGINETKITVSIKINFAGDCRTFRSGIVIASPSKKQIPCATGAEHVSTDHSCSVNFDTTWILVCKFIPIFPFVIRLATDCNFLLRKLFSWSSTIAVWRLSRKRCWKSTANTMILTDFSTYRMRHKRPSVPTQWRDQTQVTHHSHDINKNFGLRWPGRVPREPYGIREPTTRLRPILKKND